MQRLQITDYRFNAGKWYLIKVAENANEYLAVDVRLHQPTGECPMILTCSKLISKGFNIKTMEEAGICKAEDAEFRVATRNDFKRFVEGFPEEPKT